MGYVIKDRFELLAFEDKKATSVFRRVAFFYCIFLNNDDSTVAIVFTNRCLLWDLSVLTSKQFRNEIKVQKINIPVYWKV